jgi:5'-nucleotidase
MAAGTAGVTLGLLPHELLASEDFVTLTILHTNDIHCHIEPFTGTNESFAGKGGMARISEQAKLIRQKNPNTLLLDAGDMFQGTPYFNYFKGELILKLMSEADYNAGTIGNHEFDNGLEGILKPLPNATFPLINSNYDFSDTILAGKFPRWKIFRQSGIKVGIYGLGIELKGLVSEKNYGKTIYSDPLTVALEMEKFLKEDQKCDLVVCLSHLGLQYHNNKISDLVLAENTFMTDLIIGGHTHTFLEEPIIQKNKAGKQVIVNQAWWGGLEIGKIDFIFERSRKKKQGTFAEKIIT